MGVPAGIGVGASGLPPANDQANGVVSGSFAAVGPSQPFAFLGNINVAIWAAYKTTLTTTAGSTAATVASAGALAAGANINSANIPPGTTVGAITGTGVTLALPTITLRGKLNANGVISDLVSTAGLVGASVSGPGIPAGATVLAVTKVAVQSPTPGLGANTPGSVQLSTSATTPQTLSDWQQFSFALTGNAVTGGADANALFTGAAITWTAAVQLERSFDGGNTFLAGNVSLTGVAAAWTNIAAINSTFVEPERGVLYRLNCTAYTAVTGVTLNYRISSTGGAAMSLAAGGNF